MSSKKDKRERKANGAMSLNAFQGDNVVAVDNNDWAVDEEWTPGGVPQSHGAAVRKAIDMIAGNMVDFRSMPQETLNTIVPVDMPPPYVAYVANLATGSPEDDVKAIFTKGTETGEVAIEVSKIKVITREVSTFAFIGFTNREGLQNAITLGGMMVKGRKLRVDIATKEQQVRLHDTRGEARGGAAALDRDGMGNGQRGFGSQEFRENRMLDRGTFGAQQPNFRPLCRGGMGSVQPSANDLTAVGGRRGRSERGSPNTPKAPEASSGDGGFGSWRDSGAAMKQPAMRNELEKQPRGQGSRGIPNSSNANSSTNKSPSSPKPKGDFTSGGGWRAEPKAQQPAKSPSSAEPKQTTNAWGRK